MKKRNVEVIFGSEPTAVERAALDGFLRAPENGDDTGNFLRDQLHRAWRVSGELAGDPAIAARRCARARDRREPARRGWPTGLAAAAAVGIVGLSVLCLAPPSFLNRTRATDTEIASAPRQRKAITLADGIPMSRAS